MTRRGGGRAPDLRSSIYLSESDGRWHGWVTMGVKPDGRVDRRHRSAGTEHEVTAKVRELERQRDAGRSGRPGRGPTVAEWMTTWLTTIAPRRVARHTLDSTYEPKIRRWIIPGLGAHRLDRLRPEHLDAFYLGLGERGLKPNTVLQIHRILSRSLKVAQQRGLLARNPAHLVDAPAGEIPEIEPLTRKEAHRILRVCEGRRNGARWSVALALGVRQAEALGLRWSKLRAICVSCGYETAMTETGPDDACAVCAERSWDFEAEIGWQLHRERHRHGCADARRCAAARHRRPCPPDCAGHHRASCPPECAVKAHRCPEIRRPCPPDCAGHARACPERTGGGYTFTRRKGVRPGRGEAVLRLALPEPLVARLRAHHADQAAERARAGAAWQGEWGLVFPRPDGRPTDPRGDYDDWQAVLRAAGVRPARVHDARHTAGTLLVAQGVDVRTIQQILGHTSLAMTQRYTHVTRQMGRDAADRMGAALWG